MRVRVGKDTRGGDGTLDGAPLRIHEVNSGVLGAVVLGVSVVFSDSHELSGPWRLLVWAIWLYGVVDTGYWTFRALIGVAPDGAKALADGAVELFREPSGWLETRRLGVESRRIERSELATSLALRLAIRARFGLAVDLGDDSPEVLRPGDPPIAEWQPVSALPEPVDGARTSSVYRTSAAGQSVLREPFDERAGRSLRETANSFTTVVDEAALDDERLYVREGKDVASMDLALLRGAAPLGDGHVAFSFGKFTTVVFPDASASKIVRALRVRIPRRSEAPEPAAAAFEEVAEVQEVEEEAGSGARAKSTAR